MTKKIIIGVFALGLVSCASQLPLDDAYYRPAKEAPVEISSPAQVNEPETPAPSIEYLSVQDTTVTIRIKK